MGRRDVFDITPASSRQVAGEPLRVCMQFDQGNIYEEVFACWLAEHHITFVDINQSKRFSVQQQDVKNFDFLLRPRSKKPLLAEVKGRTFHGSTLAGLKGLDGWVTLEDVESMTYWQQRFQQEKPAAAAVFVFVFALEQIDVETDGQPVYDFDGRRFLLLAVPLEHYRAYMKQRSPKWQTVTLSAADFRRYAVPVEKIINQ